MPSRHALQVSKQDPRTNGNRIKDPRK